MYFFPQKIDFFTEKRELNIITQIDCALTFYLCTRILKAMDFILPFPRHDNDQTGLILFIWLNESDL